MPEPRRRAVTLVTALVVVTLAAAGCASAGSSRAASVTASASKVAAAPSAGCRPVAPATAAAPGDARETLEVDGAARWYLRHVPPSYRPGDPMPLVVDLHGYSEGAAIHEQITGLAAYGDTQGFVTATPNGSGPVPQWNFTLGSPDLAFVGKVLDDVERSTCIDTNRVFVTGFSEGAMLTSAVACEYATRVAAVAPVSGIRDIPGCRPARRVPVVAFHGTADPFLAYGGGLGPMALQLPAPDGSGKTIEQEGANAGSIGTQSVPQMTAAWAQRNGCDPHPTETGVAPAVVLVRHRCPAGADVELYRIEGGGHTWPGSPTLAAVSGLVGRTTFSISANEIMWRFFEAHPLQKAS